MMSQSANKSRDSDNGIISLSSMDEEETKVGGMRTTMTTSQQSESLKSNSDIVEMDAEANVGNPALLKKTSTFMRHDGDVSRLLGHGQSASGKRQRLKKSGSRSTFGSDASLPMKIRGIVNPLMHCAAFNAKSWNTVNGVLCEELALENPINRYTVAVSFSSNSKQMVSATSDGLATLWDVETGSTIINSDVVEAAIDGKVACCVLSPCGTVIVTGTTTGQVLAWKISGETFDMIMQEQVHTPRVIDRVKVAVAMLAISGDSQHIATAGHDGKATVWSLTGSAFPVEIMDAEIDMPDSNWASGLLYIAFANDNRTVVTCGGNGSVLVMDINTLTSRGLEHPDIVPDMEVMLCLSISKNSKWVAACGTEGNAYLWSLDEKKASEGEKFMISDTHMHSCVLDPDEVSGVPMRLVVGTEAGKVVMIDLTSENKFGSQLGVIDAKANGTGAIRHVSFSKDTNYILVSGDGEHTLVLDADQMALLYKLEPKYAGARTLAVQFSPDSSKVAVGLDDAGQGSVLVWEIDAGAAVTVVNLRNTEEDDKENPYPFATFTPQLGNQKHDKLQNLLRVAGNGYLQIWDIVNNTAKLTMDGADADPYTVAVSPCGGYVAFGTREEKLYAWDLSMVNAVTGEGGHLKPCVEGMVVGMAGRPPKKIQLSKGGQYFAAFSPGKHGTALVGELSEEAQPTTVAWSGNVINALSFIGYGSLFAICGDRPYIETWTSSPKPEMRHKLEAIAMPGGLPASFVHCDTHSEGSASWLVAAVSSLGHLCIWKGEGGAGSASLMSSGQYPGHVPETCKISPDGSQVVTYGLDGTVAVWVVSKMGSAQQSAGDAIQAPYAIMGNKSLYSVRVIDVAWSSDSSMIICCGDQGPTGGLEVAYVFSVADNCTIAELTGEPGIEFNQASFSSDNRLVALTRIDGKVVVFTRAAAKGMMVKDFSIWCNDDNTAMRTDEVIAALTEYPHAANHTTVKGHNLLTACALMKDESTLEKVIDAMPLGMGICSFTGLEDRTPIMASFYTINPHDMPDALQIAVEAKNDFLIYDLLMGVAEGRATHRSADSVVTYWKGLCKTFPTMVFVFLSKFQLGEVGRIKFTDTDDVLETKRIIVAGSRNYEEPDIGSFWQSSVYPEEENEKKIKHNQVSPTPSDTVKGEPNFEVLGEEGVMPRVAVAKRVNIPFAALPKEAGMLKPLLESEVPPEAFGTPIIRAILAWKWEQFAGRAFAIDCFYHLAQLVFFTTFAIMFTMETKIPCLPSDGIDQRPWMLKRVKEPQVLVGMIFEGLSLFVALRNLAKESRQMIAAGSMMKYFSDAWNISHSISYTIIIFILPLNMLSYYFYTCSQNFWRVKALNELIAVEVVLLWSELVHFATGFRQTGYLVRIIEQTIVDIRWFMCLQGVLMMGFGTAFAVLFYGQNCDENDEPTEGVDGATCNPGYSDIFVSMVQMFGLVLGDIGVLDYYNGSSPRPAFTTILLILYEFLVFIVLFNMLIAIMGETFANVKEIEEVEFLHGRAKIICEIEDTMKTQQLENKQLFPKYLHTLELAEDLESVAEALESMKRGGGEIPSRLKSMEAGFDTHLEDLHSEIKTLKSEFADSIQSLKDQIASTSVRR